MNVGIGERCFINNTIVIKIADRHDANSTAEAFARTLIPDLYHRESDIM